MGKIILEGMLFKSHIGVYEHEQMYGNNFEVTVEIESDTISGKTDAISETLDYNQVYQIVKTIMGNSYQLIEYAGSEILFALKNKFPSLDSILIRIAKLHPPLGGEVKKVVAELSWQK